MAPVHQVPVPRARARLAFGRRRGSAPLPRLLAAVHGSRRKPVPPTQDRPATGSDPWGLGRWTRVRSAMAPDRCRVRARWVRSATVLGRCRLRVPLVWVRRATVCDRWVPRRWTRLRSATAPGRPRGGPWTLNLLAAVRDRHRLLRPWGPVRFATVLGRCRVRALSVCSVTLLDQYRVRVPWVPDRPAMVPGHRVLGRWGLVRFAVVPGRCRVRVLWGRSATVSGLYPLARSRPAMMLGPWVRLPAMALGRCRVRVL